MDNIFYELPKTIAVCDYCNCFHAVTTEETPSGEFVYVCAECYPMFADRFDDEDEDFSV